MYDFTKSWYDNIVNGPQTFLQHTAFRGDTELKPFLGTHQAASLLGIASGPLLDSRWVEAAAKLGFDILTYKAIRSYEHKGHPLPNMVKLEDGAYTNSFGMPSMLPQYLREDIPKSYKIVKQHSGDKKYYIDDISIQQTEK